MPISLGVSKSRTCLPSFSLIARDIYCVNCVRVKRTRYVNASISLLAMDHPIYYSVVILVLID